MPINQWPIEQRPRERLIALGAGALSDAELLAIFLRTGIAGKSAVDLARDITRRFGSLGALFGCGLPAFAAIPGLGPAKYAQLQAVRELTRRALTEELQSGVLLSAPQPVKQYLQLALGGKQHECFITLFLDVRNRLLKSEELSRGTLTHASVHPREVVKAALANNAAGVILAHNHPSGALRPSHADLHLTATLKQALALVDVRVLDHLIVAGNGIYSFAENGHL
ncbi:JAB domain-containing protein [Oxalobacteraceae bacterium CAVE-383]|nr:JAB domain-containing protein [Oxalobacteraceae bacterium CAVE-383]